MTQPEIDTRRQRWVLVALFALFVLPLFGAWYLLFFTSFGEGGGANHGDLIEPPRPLPDLRLTGAATGGSLHGKWTLVYLLDGNCGDACESNLYRMRQLRLAQGADAGRVQRLLLVFDHGGAVPEGPLRDYPGQLMAEPAPDLLEAFRLSEADDPLNSGRLYLVDPRGFLMMTWDRDADPGGIIDDLERLLRYSGSG